MNEVKVSIIVPVYNVEKYLTVCMESLVQQTLKDIEIIVVNDGSPDNSIKILEKYEKKYPDKVRVFTTENRGVSHARNYGLDRAVGEFIMFVDSDDYIELNMAEKLYTKAITDNNDLVLCARYNVYEVPGKEELQKKEMKVFYMNQNYKMSERKFEYVHASPFPWDKLFKRSLLDGIRFPEGLRFEDLVVAFEVLSIAENIGVVPEPLYYYRKTTQVGFLNSFSEATKDIVTVFGLLFKFMREHNLYDIFKEELEYVCVRHFFYRYESFYDHEKKGQLPLKIDIINATQDFLIKELPGWSDNHYLKYTAAPSLKKHLKYYADRKKTIRYVTLTDRLPVKVLRILSKIRDKGNKLLEQGRKFKKSKKKISLIQKKFKKLKIYKLFNLPADMRYTKYYEKFSVREKDILFESKHGEDLAGNIFNMIYECKREKYRNFNIYLALKKELYEVYEEQLNSYGINYVKFIEIQSEEYLKALASAKYLITDTSFPPYYIKKSEQVYLNTWHGTPLKAMGRIVQDREYGLGNVQRNFYIADYLLYQNEFSEQVFFNDYMLEEAFGGKVLLSGYPRNSSFFRKERRDQIRKECFLTEKEVIVYMPTWRGLLHKKQNKEQVDKIFGYLAYLDRKLKPNQVLYVKLHPFVKNGINYKELLNVREFPASYETYDFLNASDMLITDYSSIMFDYAVSGKKIILFTYDREEYLGDRGIYIGLDEMDLPKVDTVKELLKEINTKDYGYPKFFERFCSLDSADCARNVCDTMFLGEDTGLRTVDYSASQTTNTLLYIRGLRDSKENMQLIEDLNGLKNSKSHIYLNFKASALKKYSRNLSLLNKNIGYIPLSAGRDNTFMEYAAFALTFRFGIVNKFTKNKLKTLAERENLKTYGNIKFDTVINYSGMDLFLLHQFELLADRKIYCFSDFNEDKYKQNKKYRKNIEYALRNLDNYTMVVIPPAMDKLKSVQELKKKVKVIISGDTPIQIEMLLKEAK